jgi:hypothetical protein
MMTPNRSQNKRRRPRQNASTSNRWLHTSIEFEAHGKAHFSDWNSWHGVADVIYVIDKKDRTNPLAGEIRFVKAYRQKSASDPHGEYEEPHFTYDTIDRWKGVSGCSHPLVQCSFRRSGSSQANGEIGPGRSSTAHSQRLASHARTAPCRPVWAMPAQSILPRQSWPITGQCTYCLNSLWQLKVE